MLHASSKVELIARAGSIASVLCAAAVSLAAACSSDGVNPEAGVADAATAAKDAASRDGTTPEAAADAATAAEDAAGHDGTGPDAGDANAADASPLLPNAGTVTIHRDGGSPIGPLAIGHNYFDWVDWAGDGVTGVTGTEGQVAALGVKALRAGGNNNDLNGPAPAFFDSAQVDAFVAYCRAVGAEPILQVPILRDVDGNPATAQTAADMVTYANVTKGYGVRYWEIGNEPDLYPLSYDAGVPLTPADLCSVYQSFEPAMKAANAAAADGGVSMTFLGPELSYQYFPGIDYLTPFLDACKNYVDVVAVHRYPFGGGTEPGVTGTSIRGSLTDVSNFRTTVASLQSIVANHARPGTPLAITETNISFDYLPSAYTSDAALAAPGTFYAGMWTADILGASLESGLWTLAVWEVGDTSTAPTVLGFLESQQPVPAYYTMQMISANFHGDTVVPSGVPSGFSVYASYDQGAATTSIVILNKTAPASNVSIAIDSLPVQSFAVPALSASLIQIPDSAGHAHVLRYTQDQADAGTGPLVIQ